MLLQADLAEIDNDLDQAAAAGESNGTGLTTMTSGLVTSQLEAHLFLFGILTPDGALAQQLEAFAQRLSIDGATAVRDEWSAVSSAINAQVIRPRSGHGSLQYALQVYAAAMDIQQDICSGLLSAIKQDTADKTAMSQALMTFQRARPNDAGKTVGIVPEAPSDLNGEEAHAWRQKQSDDTLAILNCFIMDPSDMPPALRDVDGDGVLDTDQEGFDNFITRLQNKLVLTDQSQSQLTALYNQHSSHISTIAQLLNRLIQQAAQTDTSVASHIR